MASVLDDGVTEWVESILHGAVVDLVPMRGGMSTVLHRVITTSGSSAVLRRYPADGWSDERARAAAFGEAWVLDRLRRHPVVCVPAPIAMSLEAAVGRPAVLMGFCEGSRLRATTTGVSTQLISQLGRILAAVHAVVVPRDAPLRNETELILKDLAARQAHRYGVPGSRLGELVRESQPRDLDPTIRALLHTDFGLSNVLLCHGRVSTVLDWPGAAAGDPASDVGFAIATTAVSFGRATADAFLDAYQAATTGVLRNLPWWTLVAAGRLEPDIDSWTNSANFLGPSGLTPEAVRRRFRHLVTDVARQL